MAIELKMALGSLTTFPRGWLQLADRITVDHDDPNITSFKVSLESIDGTRVLFNDNEPGVPKDKPTAMPEKYASSAGQDYGAGIITDLASDTIVADGMSATTMADPSLSYAFQLLEDRTAAFLVFEIEVSNTAIPVTIKQPRIEYTLSASRRMIWENAHQLAVIHPDGPGVRFGQMNTGESGTIEDPPLVYDGASRPNSLDWRIYSRICLEGRAPDDLLSAELAADRDTFEGQSVGNERNNSHGLVLPNLAESTNWHIALISSLAEIPPLMMLPRKIRSESTWLEDGDLALYSYALIQEPDYLISPRHLSELRESDLLTVWSSEIGTVAGWRLASHLHSLNNEEYGFGLFANGDQYISDLRPFRGWYSVIGKSKNEGGDVCIRHVRGGRVSIAVVSSDRTSIVVKVGQFYIPPWYSTVEAVSGADLSSPSISIGQQDEMLLAYCDSSGAKYKVSYDEALTWSDAVALIAGATIVRTDDHPFSLDSVGIGFVPDDSSDGSPGVLKVVQRDAGTVSFSSAANVKDAAGADFRTEAMMFDLSWSTDAGSRLLLVCIREGATDFTTWQSFDGGSTFREVV